MKVVIQRVISASVKVNNSVVGSIEQGMLILVGFTEGDNIDKIDKLTKKIVNIRIFNDENDKMNKSLLDTNGSILSVSQFTLYANTDNGRRPSFEKQLNYNDALNLYKLFNIKLRENNVNVAEGLFGEYMEINQINDGPVTIIMEE